MIWKGFLFLVRDHRQVGRLALRTSDTRYIYIYTHTDNVRSSKWNMICMLFSYMYYICRVAHGYRQVGRLALESKRGRTNGKKKGTRKGNTVIIKRCGCGSVFSWHSEEARLLLFHSYFYYYSFFFLICALFSFAFSRSLLLFLLLLLLLLLLYHSISCIKHR